LAHMASSGSSMAGTVGLVPLLGRGPLASATFRDRPLFMSAVDSLVAAGARAVLVLAAASQMTPVAESLRGQPAIELVECPDAESRVREAVSEADDVVVHDPLCPLVPASVLREAVDRREPGTASVALLDLVDTVKATREAFVRSTLDRGTVRIVGSPVVLSGVVLRDLPDLTAAVHRPAALPAAIARRCPLRVTATSPLSMRAEDESSLRVLAALDAVASGA
jgi:2-C-methyl-D-erythritol 4-phosphate cytidylyltransferase